MKKKSKLLIALLVIIFAGIYYYVTLPAINLHSTDTWFFVIALIVKSALGMGDVKMFFVIGLLYGLSNTYSILLFSVLVMAIVSIVLLIMKKVTRKTAIPMAPFVAFGFLLNVLMGM